LIWGYGTQPLWGYTLAHIRLCNHEYPLHWIHCGIEYSGTHTLKLYIGYSYWWYTRTHMIVAAFGGHAPRRGAHSFLNIILISRFTHWDYCLTKYFIWPFTLRWASHNHCYLEYSLSYKPLDCNKSIRDIHLKHSALNIGSLLARISLWLAALATIVL
jgi:hypothetical protein